MLKRLRSFIVIHPVIFLSLLYFPFRLVNLTLLPIFIDEATYLDWGWRTIHASGLFFFPLVFNKMPLVMWLFGLSQNLTANPLLAGRLVTVLAGWFVLIGIFKLSQVYFNLKTSLLASFLYLIIPIFVFFDRQALMETEVAAVGLWTCYFLIKFIQGPRLLWSVLIGFSLGVGYLIKASCLVYIPVVMIIVFWSVWKTPSHRKLLLIHSVYLFLALLITISPLLFQPAYWQTARDIFYFSLTPSEVAGLPFVFWLKNLYAHLEISFWYLTPPLLLAAVLGIKKTPVFTAWTFITLILTTIVVRNSTTRYLAPYLPPLLIFAANWLSRRKLYLILLFSVPCLLVTGLLMFNPPQYFTFLSHFTRFSQIADYLTGRDTGYQAIATINYLNANLPKNTPVYLGVAANAGNPEQAVFSYLRRRPNTLIGYFDDHVLPKNINDFSCLSSSIPVFFIARHNEQGGLHRFYTLVATVTNPYNSDYNNIYTLTGPCPENSPNIDPLISYYRFLI